ncbi:PQQ-binding-like beta-propeller repeat protein [Kitasatospora sp. NPDC058162]|uniref:outer membrane protein assembly factor BamB family protein n=1 Tax=Kitasatospora sp. NPDC058162 TaxID=3346362 RepID=UPI0036DAF379
MVADRVPVRVERGAGDGLWTLVAPPWSLSEPVVSADRVHVLVDGRPTACDRADGTVLWQSAYRCLEDEWIATLAPEGGPVVVVSGLPDGYHPVRLRIAVLDPASGAVNWQTETDGSARYWADGESLVLREPAPADRETLSDGQDPPLRLTVLDLADGARRWQHTFTWIGSAALVQGRVLAQVRAGDDFTARAFDARTGAELWSRTGCIGSFHLPNDGPRPGEPPFFVWNWIDDRMRWLSLATGEEVGEFRIVDRGPHGARRPLITDGGHTVWLAGTGRTVHAFHPRAGSGRTAPAHVAYGLRHALTLGDGPIAAADGWLYAIDQGNRLVAARVGLLPRSVLRPVRWPEHLSGPDYAADAFRGLSAGAQHVYAQTNPVAGPRSFQHVAALQHGRVLWQLPCRYGTRVVPAGDRVLITTGDRSCDLLRMVDGETGAFAGPDPAVAVADGPTVG